MSCGVTLRPHGTRFSTWSHATLRVLLLSSRPVGTTALLELVRSHWRRPSGWENGLHRTLDVQFREAGYRLRRGHAPAMMDILHRAALNRVRTGPRNFGADMSIGLSGSWIGHHPRLRATALP